MIEKKTLLFLEDNIVAVPTVFLLAGFWYSAIDENVWSAFRRQLVHHRVPGRYEAIFFPASSNTWYNLTGIGVLLIVLEWLVSGHEQMLFLALN